MNDELLWNKIFGALLGVLLLVFGLRQVSEMAFAISPPKVAGDKIAHDLGGWMMMPLALGLVWLELWLMSWLFVEVEEVSATKEYKKIFSGWMFAASPGLHGIEHPIYDIWLTGCEAPGETIVEAPQTADADTSTPPAGDSPPAAPAPATVEPAPKPRPKRIVRAAPPPVEQTQPVAERREPTQRFFPAAQYPSDFGGRDPAGNGNH